MWQRMAARLFNATTKIRVVVGYKLVNTPMKFQEYDVGKSPEIHYNIYQKYSRKSFIVWPHYVHPSINVANKTTLKLPS